MTLAAQTQFRQEYIAGFEQRSSLLRKSVTTEVTIKGNQATFLVADSGSATAKTRGKDGRIPARTDNLAQNTATLVEKHDLVERTGFDIFSSQGDGWKIMQDQSAGVIHRDIDQVILTELNTGTQNWVASGGQKATLSACLHAKTVLLNAEVPGDNRISAAISPAFEAYLMQIPEFSSVDWVDGKPFTTDQRMFRWMGVNWICHPNIAGKGTTTEDCVMYHMDAIGHAYATQDIQTEIGRNGEHDYSWVRTTCFHGPKLLQNSGVILMTHDGSEFAAL